MPVGLLGEGGMGRVLLVHDMELDRPAAFKVLRASLTTDPAAVARFEREVRLTAQLDHPGIPTVLGRGTLDDKRPWYAMTLVRGTRLDQAFLAGLGNIYVDESLFRARLHPLTPSDRVSAAKARALHEAITQVLAEAIEREGSSFDGFYRTPTGQPGSYQDQFQVYGRHGKPCRSCGATVTRIVVGQRGTHSCPRCQRPPRP